MSYRKAGYGDSRPEQACLYDRTVRYSRVSAVFFLFYVLSTCACACVRVLYFCIFLYYVYQRILTLAWVVESSRSTVREASPASGSAMVSPLCSPGSVASTNSTVVTSSCIKASKEILVVICAAIRVICPSRWRLLGRWWRKGMRRSRVQVA